jgi:hypothetical protein
MISQRVEVRNKQLERESMQLAKEEIMKELAGEVGMRERARETHAAEVLIQQLYEAVDDL